MLVWFAMQANLLTNMEFEFECFFTNVKIVEFRMLFYSQWMDIYTCWSYKKVVKANRTNMLVWFVGQHVVRFAPALKQSSFFLPRTTGLSTKSCQASIAFDVTAIQISWRLSNSQFLKISKSLYFARVKIFDSLWFSPL